MHRHAIRLLPGGPGRTQHQGDRSLHANPLPGYLCEQCQDAPAVLLRPTPRGGEMDVCTACSAPKEPTRARVCSSHPGWATGGRMPTTQTDTEFSATDCSPWGRTTAARRLDEKEH
jgi:hypothetical protein